MNLSEMEQLLRNLDQRVDRIEQFLPALATKDELRAELAKLATKDELRAEVATLATKDELRAEVAKLATKDELRAEVATLATKVELRAEVAKLATKDELQNGLADTRAELGTEIREEGERSRRYFDIVAESLREDNRLLAEGLAGVMQRLDRMEAR